MSLARLLERDDVVEEVALRSTVGVCAYHGGDLERATDVVAREAARRAGASYYGLLLPDAPGLHLPSSQVDPAVSPAMGGFFAHIDTVVTVHGFGRRDRLRTVLLGGRNRDLASHLGAALRRHLGAAFTVVDDLAEIPEGLRGLHPRNPVNLPANGGVQIELPPGARWNRTEHGWSDCDGVGRADQLDRVIDALTEVLGGGPVPEGT